MAKAKTAVKTISDKLSKVSEQFTVYMYDNGYMFEISGRDRSGEYKTVKIMCTELAQVSALMQEATELERDE